MKENSQIGWKNDLVCEEAQRSPDVTSFNPPSEIAVALLTAGRDRPYVFGLATELLSKGAAIDLIGSDYVDFPEFHVTPRMNFLNLRGDQDPRASLPRKVLRILKYYAELIRYAATAKPKVFHILWNNKFELIDRTLLMFYYKLCGKKIVLTLHNVNAGRRDSTDSLLNRLTLRIQYRLADHVFVHTEQMKVELREDFGVDDARVTVIPFGINNAVPNTLLTPAEARKQLGIRETEKVILFFGNITPYKGLEYLIDAFQKLLDPKDDYRLIIAGQPKNCETYWAPIRDAIQGDVQAARIMLKADYVADEETELYFKAADVLALPYTHVYQSGVLFLGYSFGLPVLAADVGSLKADLIEGTTGFVFRPKDAADLARALKQYFASDLFANLSRARRAIKEFARDRNSWDIVGQRTMSVYARLLQIPFPGGVLERNASKTSLDVEVPS